MDNDLEQLWLMAPQITIEGVRELIKEIHALRKEQAKKTGLGQTVPGTSADLLRTVAIRRVGDFA